VYGISGGAWVRLAIVVQCIVRARYRDDLRGGHWASWTQGFRIRCRRPRVRTRRPSWWPGRLLNRTRERAGWHRSSA